MKNYLRIAYLRFVMNWHRDRCNKIMANYGIEAHKVLLISNPAYQDAYNRFSAARSILKELGEVKTA